MGPAQQRPEAAAPNTFALWNDREWRRRKRRASPENGVSGRSGTSVECGHVRIFIQHKPQGRLQGAEPRLVIAPAVVTLAIDRPSNLFGAYSLNDPFCFMELQARLFERQRKIFQQAANFIFRLRYKILIDHAVHLSRHNRVKMRHQPDVVAVVPADIRQARKKRGIFREYLYELGKTRRERVSTDVNDFRVWQDETDQSNMREICSHLIDEEWPAKFAMGRGTFKIGFSKGLEVARSDTWENGGIGSV